jgi:cobaltochelatase CobN
VPIIFYRALLLAADTAAIDALCAALAARGLAPAPLAVTSLKETEARAFISDALARLNPAVIVTTTAFAAGGAPGEPTALDGPDVPVLQAVIATTKRAAWRDSPRGLGAADLAMHVVLPELDGRVLAGAIAFKDTLPPLQPAPTSGGGDGGDELAFTALANRPEPDRIDAVAGRVVALARLQAKPRGERRVAVLMPDYPGAPGRAGYAVGLDVPSSVLALLADLAAAGYRVDEAPQTSRALLDALEKGSAHLPLDAYARLLVDFPGEAVAKIHEAWGDAADDPDVAADGFRFRAIQCGNVIVALPPDRGRTDSRRADYHDPALPPRHALVAFALWLRHVERIDELVHMGAHGTLEWLPGKAVALTSGCFPEALIGSLPVIYPFIVSNPGEAAQAKRRLAAVTIGHLPPPLVAADLSGEARALERLVEEYVQAEGLDRRRHERLARLIVETAQRSGLAREAGIEADADPDAALRRIDAWLCDLKDLAIKDGLHVYGRGARSDHLPLEGGGRPAPAGRVGVTAAPQMLRGCHPTPDRLRRSDPPPPGEGC